MKHIGINDSGDFDQLSLAGVDFGEDYCQDYGVQPTNLQGDYMNAQQLGVYPETLSGDFNQMGVMPEGLGCQQLGHMPAGLGHMPEGLGHGHHQQLGAGMMDKWTAMSTMNKALVGGGVAVAVLLLAKQMGWGKKLPVFG